MQGNNSANRDLHGYVLFFVVCGVLSVMATAKYYSLHSTYFDLGVYFNQFSRIANGEWQRIFFGHAYPLILPWAWLYKVLQGDLASFFILIFQSALITLPVIWLYKKYGVIPAVAFSLYFPIWYNGLFDFHIDHMAIPLLFGFFFFEKKGLIWTSVILAFLLALVKEPFALQTVACGLYLSFVRKHRLAGVTLMVGGLLYFLLATRYLIPYFYIGDKVGLDSPAFSWMGNSLGEMLWFIFTKPHIIFQEVLYDTSKLGYLFFIFSALAFIPLLRPDILVVALPIIAIPLLSKIPNYSGLMFHYTAGLIAPLVIAFAEGLPCAKRIWIWVKLPIRWFTPVLLTLIVVVHIIIAPSPISWAFWNTSSESYRYTTYLPSTRDRSIRAAIKTHIPSNPEIEVTTQNTVNLTHLANRKTYFPFPEGIFKPYIEPQSSDRTISGFIDFIKLGKSTPARTKIKWTHYVLLDLKRHWYIGDQGCSWENGHCKSHTDDFSTRFLSLVQKTNEQFDTIYQKDGFIILRRKISPKETS